MKTIFESNDRNDMNSVHTPYPGRIWPHARAYTYYIASIYNGMLEFISS